MDGAVGEQASKQARQMLASSVCTRTGKDGPMMVVGDEEIIGYQEQTLAQIVLVIIRGGRCQMRQMMR